MAALELRNNLQASKSKLFPTNPNENYTKTKLN